MKSSLNAIAFAAAILAATGGLHAAIVGPNIPGDLCGRLGKPLAMEFQYIPGSTVDTNQDPSRVGILFDSGSPDNDGVSYFIVTDESDYSSALSGAGSRFFLGQVAVGEILLAVGPFFSDTYFHLFDDSSGGPIQSVRYHTSCSQPIELGDVIGSVTLVGYEGEKGSASLFGPSVPEPSSIVLWLMLAMAGVLCAWRRSRTASSALS